MKILLVAATSYEIAPILQFLEQNSTSKNFFEFQYKNHLVYPLVTGVGSTLTAFNMGRFIHADEIDLALNLGLAGSFHKEIPLGKVVKISNDRFADLGVEEQDGSFTDIFQLGLLEKDQFPFSDGIIHQINGTYFTEYQNVNAITVNKVHGTNTTIDKIIEKYNPDVESMEGAAFFYAAKMMQLDYIQLRSISNYVEPRNRDAWEIKSAIDNLCDAFINFIENT